MRQAPVFAADRGAPRCATYATAPRAFARTGRGARRALGAARQTRRCTLPITPLRRKCRRARRQSGSRKDRSDQSFLSSSTRSSVHDMPNAPCMCGKTPFSGPICVRIPTRPRRRVSPPSRYSERQRFRRLSAARYVVLDNQKATIWPESDAKSSSEMSPHIPAFGVDEVGTNGGSRRLIILC